MFEEQKEEYINDKQFDIYTHLKMNIKTSSPICELHESKQTHYCFNCKRSVCEVCKDSFHLSHLLQEKRSINFDEKKLSIIFDRLEALINTTRVFTEPEKMKKDLVNRINDEFDMLETGLKELKRKKMKEIESVFGDNRNAKNLMKNISETRKKLGDFYENSSNFFYNDEIKDDDNTIFLIAYDIFNMASNVSKDYTTIIEQIRSYYKGFEEGKNKRTDEINKAIQSALEEEKKNEIFSTNLTVIDNAEGVFEVRNSQEDAFKVKVISNFERLGEDLYKDLKERIEKINEFISNFKSQTFNSFKKHGSLVDIEKTLKAYDEKTNKRTNFTKGKSFLKFSPSQAKAYSITGALPSSAKIITQSQKNMLSSEGSLKVRKDNLNSLNSLDKEKENYEKERESKEKKEKKEKKSSKLLKDLKNKDNSESVKVKLNHFGNTNSLKEALKGVLNSDENKGLTALEEHSEEEYETTRNEKKRRKNEENKDEDEDEKEKDEEEDEENEEDEDENDKVKLENGFNSQKKDKKQRQLEKMFKPILKNEKKQVKPIKEKKIITEEEKKNKITNKLQEIIKENQRLTSMIKKQDDVNLVNSTIRRFYSYQALEFIRKNFYIANKGYSSNLLLTSNVKDEHLNSDNIKIFEGTNEVQIYDRDKRRLIRKSIQIDKKDFGTSVFLYGSRTFYHSEALYISGGKDMNEDKNYFWIYNIKDNKLSVLPSMNKTRSYHTITFHENLKSMIVIGGENNKSCEIYDFFLNSWTELPDLNYPRANISLHIDKIGTFAYAIGGIKGDIIHGTNSEMIELLDLVEINQGWAKVEYRNKANVDMTFSNKAVYPLTEDKLLIYGAMESRGNKKCYVVFDLKTFDIQSISQETVDEIKIASLKNPELSKIFS